MMRYALTAVLLMLTWGCGGDASSGPSGPSVPCETDSDCPSGSKCDLSANQCELDGSGGAAGQGGEAGQGGAAGTGGTAGTGGAAGTGGTAGTGGEAGQGGAAGT
ncbi:MAG: hypothetical protein ACPGQS_11370, partial [Bradymonadia bacterium]